MSAKKELIKKAMKKYKNIFPCGDKKSFSECFTFYDNELFFWFNTKDNTTRVMAKKQK